MRPASRAPMLAPSMAYDPVLFVAADVRPSKATSVATSIVYLLEVERPQEQSDKRAGAEAEDVSPHSGRGRGRPPGDLRGCPAGHLGSSAEIGCPTTLLCGPGVHGWSAPAVVWSGPTCGPDWRPHTNRLPAGVRERHYLWRVIPRAWNDFSPSSLANAPVPHCMT